ncbi:MAG: flagellar export chaperone FlgN [Candidatus Acidiferrales bacterium]
MTSESTRYLKLLERRLDLLGALSDTLAKSRTDFVSMDLGAMERRIAEQEQFCKQIRSLDADITNAQVRCAQSAGLRPCTDAISWPPATGGDVRQDEQIQITLGRIAAAQVELKRINDSHQAMLRRSKRTVQVLLNLFNSFAPTYSAPGAVGTTYEERV